MISINEATKKFNDHMYGQNIKPGMKVCIVQKHHQRSGELTCGVVKNLLTNKGYHSRGIKVRLETGEVGRVQQLNN